MARQAILLTHRRRFSEAEKRLKEAKSLLEGMERHLSGWRELGGSGMVHTPYQEFAEAKILLAYIQSGQIPDSKSIEVPAIPYVLGLADFVGELRRLTLDSMRAGDFDTAERALTTMEDIYALLMTLDTAPAITPGLRHKNDSARRLIEVTRGDVTLEARRRSFERSLIELQAILEDRQDGGTKKKQHQS
jgi:translin